VTENPRWIPLDVDSLDPDPFVAFETWWAEAIDVVSEPESICLATADAAGRPRARMVLLRARDARGFCFFTNYESRKGQDLAENPRAAIVWYIEPLGRQVRIEGEVEQLSGAESDAYFASRARGHQLGAHASNQGRVVESRAALEAQVEAVTADFEGVEVSRPAHWGGYRLVPDHFEFWQHRGDRLHDRIVYEALPGGDWSRVRQQP
jgi:pyridoxamine 5'-phosphate oxidase